VGKTLNGVLTELFLGVFEGVFAGVEEAGPADLLFLGDDRATSS